MVNTMARPPELPGHHGLFPDEYFWREHYKWLLDRGYSLRPRYHPDWEPSWKGTRKDSDECEDGQTPLYTTIMDARRVSDDTVVAIKRLKRSQHPLEVDIVQSFSQSPLVDDPRNHTVPILDVLRSPHDDDMVLLVMPYLTPCEKVPFTTVGEVAEYFQQLLDGLRFIHEHNVAHRDIMASNVMMQSSIYSETPHPIVRSKSYNFKRPVKYATRTERPVKYYYTDFGISCRLPGDGKEPLEPPIMGGDRTVPEYQRPAGSQNPYRTDVYCLGNTIRTQFLEKYTGLELFADLVNMMVQADPRARPTAAHAYDLLREVLGGTPPGNLRARLAPRRENALVGLFRACAHAIRTVSYVMGGKPALPVYSETVAPGKPAKRSPEAPSAKPRAIQAPNPPPRAPAKASPAPKAPKAKAEQTKKSKQAKALEPPKKAKSKKTPAPSASPNKSNKAP